MAAKRTKPTKTNEPIHPGSAGSIAEALAGVVRCVAGRDRLTVARILSSAALLLDIDAEVVWILDGDGSP